MAHITLSHRVDKKNARITIRMSDDTKKELESAAAQRARSAGWLAVDIIERWLRARRKSK